ncbi:hypothetical protein TNCT_386141 [Trichonephila clavata]|uniref:Uncharacterized protein n=1 Tax=Trichonephila clavata TaxID=2740835 RepID=A0A8X6K6E9_TRICU|nr:hypothetical protein TNCT_386141 [Trichonephila clavata]
MQFYAVAKNVSCCFMRKEKDPLFSWRRIYAAEKVIRKEQNSFLFAVRTMEPHYTCISHERNVPDDNQETFSLSLLETLSIATTEC